MHDAITCDAILYMARLVKEPFWEVPVMPMLVIVRGSINLLN